jgi:fused signal recognition particle receptor
MVTGFFKKLTNKLFNSSSKFSKNLENVVDEAAESEEDLKSSVNEEKHVEKPKIKEPEKEKIEKKETKVTKVLKDSFSFLKRKVDKRKVLLNDEFLEKLEDILIASDVGASTALKVSEKISSKAYGKKVAVIELKEYLAEEIAEILEPVAKPIPIYKSTPQVILIVGVNGSGKTTTIGKLASQFKLAGKSVMIGAGDTFRAAAIEQLAIWAERVNVPIVTAKEGSDPASLSYSAVEKAVSDNADLLFIDTAGRLQNKSDLMQELVKVVNVIKKVKKDAPENVILVLDATTGQNIISQVEVFQEMVNVTGLIMTKLDGSAKGGILVAVADKFKLPIHAIGIGETIDDLQPFDPKEFAMALLGDFRE